MFFNQIRFPSILNISRSGAFKTTGKYLKFLSIKPESELRLFAYIVRHLFLPICYTITNMDQKKLWQTKWSDKTSYLPPNNFANRAYKMIKPKHKTLLDLGCGNGRDSLYFARKGLKVTAADWSQSSLDQLQKLAEKRKVANFEVVQQNISKLMFKPNSFDVIYAHLSLHYFDDKTTREIFNKLYGVLKKDGLLFVKCKSTDDMLYGRGRKLEENMYEHREHVRHFFDKEYMNALLAKFQIIKVRRSSSIYHSYKSSFIEAIAKKSGQK